MKEEQRKYIAIDLKSFYASVECVERGRDALTTNLVVADASRTEKTICLAVTPSLKAYGIPGRARLFEVIQKVKEINQSRLCNAPNHTFTGKSDDAVALKNDPSLELDFIIATPQMAHYMDVSSKIFQIYMSYISPEDIHVYSVDEVFMDVTKYLRAYHMTPHEMAMVMIRDVLNKTGITATAGIGDNLFLCKVAMDIVAKHMPADRDGVRIAELSEHSFREQLWGHRPLTDFWRIGKGIAGRLESLGLFTMGDIARCSVGQKNEFFNEELLYRTFGVNAELIIDHAWGWEPCTIADIKAYRPESNSLSSGQVLSEPYNFEKGKLIVREMTDRLVLDLVDKDLVTDQIVLNISYDTGNLSKTETAERYRGAITTDWYGRSVPKDAHGTVTFPKRNSSTQWITEKVMELFDRIVDPALYIRRVNIAANRVVHESEISELEEYEQLDMFTDYEALEKQREKEKEKLEGERKIQKAVLAMQKKYGKNAVLKGMNLEEGGTMIDRNRQIGGHKA